MQNVIDVITGNLGFFIGLFVFVLVLVGLVLALLTPAGRETLGRAAVKLAVSALGFAEKWLGREIIGEKLAAIDARQAPPQHPIIQAQIDLQSWLDAS
jgi:cbb3-type cytochrome oxidase subunit 3